MIGSVVTTLLLVCGCTTTQPEVENMIRVPKSFSEVVTRVSVGMESDIKHRITFTENAVKYRKEEISRDITRFDVWTWAPDLGDLPVFAHVDVMRVSGSATNIRIRETPPQGTHKRYMTAKIRGWFPSAQ